MVSVFFFFAFEPWSCIFQFLPEMGITIGCVCVLLIGCDRMFSVIFAVSYKRIAKSYYHVVSMKYHTCIIVYFIADHNCSSRSLYTRLLCHLLILHPTVTRKGNLENTNLFSIGLCEILTPFSDGLPLFTFPILVINILSIVVYIIVWIRLRMNAGQYPQYRIRSDVNSFSEATLMNRIFKSLLIIVSVDSSGWLLTPIFIYVVLHSSLNGDDYFQSNIWSNRIFQIRRNSLGRTLARTLSTLHYQ